VIFAHFHVFVIMVLFVKCDVMYKEVYSNYVVLSFDLMFSSGVTS